MSASVGLCVGLCVGLRVDACKEQANQGEASRASDVYNNGHKMQRQDGKVSKNRRKYDKKRKKVSVYPKK